MALARMPLTPEYVILWCVGAVDECAATLAVGRAVLLAALKASQEL